MTYDELKEMMRIFSADMQVLNDGMTPQPTMIEFFMRLLPHTRYYKRATCNSAQLKRAIQNTVWALLPD